MLRLLEISRSRPERVATPGRVEKYAGFDLKMIRFLQLPFRLTAKFHFDIEPAHTKGNSEEIPPFLAGFLFGLAVQCRDHIVV